MAKDPAFLFYPGDWLCGTLHMQRICRACYFDLLMLQFNRGAFSEAEALDCLGVDSDKWILIKDKFVCDNSKYYNVRMKQEIDKRKAFCESKKHGAYAMHMHMHNENENKDSISSSESSSDGESEGVQVDDGASWKKSFETYRTEAEAAKISILGDNQYLEERRKYHPALDVELSIEKAFADFWATEAGWAYKKRTRCKKIDWRRTTNNALALKQNQVYRKRGNEVV